MTDPTIQFLARQLEVMRTAFVRAQERAIRQLTALGGDPKDFVCSNMEWNGDEIVSVCEDTKNRRSLEITLRLEVAEDHKIDYKAEAMAARELLTDRGASRLVDVAQNEPWLRNYSSLRKANKEKEVTDVVK